MSVPTEVGHFRLLLSKTRFTKAGPGFISERVWRRQTAKWIENEKSVVVNKTTYHNGLVVVLIDDIKA